MRTRKEPELEGIHATWPEEKPQAKSYAGADYRYSRLTAGLLMNDFRFKRGTPVPGTPFPDFDLRTTAGNAVRKADYVGRKPLLLVFGSATCPMTISSLPALKRLHSEFGREVEFVTLYVREAHPGEKIPQPQAFQEKLDNARSLKKLEGIAWSVAVDDMDGTLHRLLDTKPNAAYLMGRDGRLAFRSLWAGDEKGLRLALQALSVEEIPAKQQSRAMIGPLSQGLGHIQEILSRAGGRAQRDMILAAPPMALAGWLAALFRPLSKEKRGLATLTTLGALASIFAAALIGWFA